MNIKFTPLGIGIITALIVLTLVMIFLGFKPTENAVEMPQNLYQCAGQYVPFRANITDCLAVRVRPTEQALLSVITDPTIAGLYILVEPNGSTELGMSVYEVYKTLSSLYIPSSIAYTEPWENQPQAPVLSIENATYSAPIIWLREGQDHTLIEVNGSSVIVYAKSPYDMDAATCRISILAINEKIDCEIR